MAEQAFMVTIEASGEVTPAALQPDAVEVAEAEATDVEEPSDG